MEVKGVGLPEALLGLLCLAHSIITTYYAIQLWEL